MLTSTLNETKAYQAELKRRFRTKARTQDAKKGKNRGKVRRP